MGLLACCGPARWVCHPAVSLALEQLPSLVDTWGASSVRSGSDNARLQLAFTFKSISSKTTLGLAWLGHFFDFSDSVVGIRKDIIPSSWPAYPLKRTFTQPVWELSSQGTSQDSQVMVR